MKALVRPEAPTRRPSTISSASSGSRAAISASSGSSSTPSGSENTPSTHASSAPGRTICGRARPPISRSSECASTVLPAPVSPVIAFSPRLEAQLGALDQQQVLDPQLVQHRRPF